MQNLESSVLNDIIEISQEEDVSTVNKMLSNGWILLKIYTTASVSEPDQMAHYIMGRMIEKRDPFEKFMDL
ncbi:hypothetical protein [Sebaldella sp. S0638]|uniref:hypothetical protein n=1 Tax=Sebaldella sp. S0638 TaxID=2957809 RepID=UPI0020A12915|nr:hypothetical protein [Sebaldella sp. S0638]MCP1226757.1 hypothetical protein [Sebaldella sp. S0638]